MDKLPAELISSIFELAIADDLDTACQLCLINRGMQKIVLPLLYKHVCLSDTDEVKSFNATIASSPKLGELVHGVTLSDGLLARISPDSISAALQIEKGWTKQWKKLIEFVGKASRQHNLKTLVLTEEACRRLTFVGKKKKTLGHTLKQSRLRLDHLVVSHASIRFFLTRLKTRSLSWYGCNFIFDDETDLDRGESSSIISTQLEEINIMMSDNYNHMNPLDDEDDDDDDSDDDSDTTFNETRENRRWPAKLVTKLRELYSTQIKTPKVNVLVHLQTQEAKEQLAQKVKDLDFPVDVGDWGRASDSNHTVAQLENLASKGWIHSGAMDLISKEKTKDKDEDEDDSQDSDDDMDGWKAAVPIKQWCRCKDLGYGSDLDMDEEDYWDEGMGMGGWSDDSDNWNPMQRMAFLSGESYHYNQDYLDAYGL
jgi:hypothetical protein